MLRGTQKAGDGCCDINSEPIGYLCAGFNLRSMDPVVTVSQGGRRKVEKPKSRRRAGRDRGVELLQEVGRVNRWDSDSVWVESFDLWLYEAQELDKDVC